MPLNLKFDFKQLHDFDGDLRKSSKALPAIVRQILRQQGQRFTKELRPRVPRQTGRLRRSLGFSLSRNRNNTRLVLGFMLGRRVSASTAVAGNVLQAGGARPRKGKYLWIPLPENRDNRGDAITKPRQLLGSGGFIKRSRAGNIIAFRRSGEDFITPMFVLKTQTFVERPIPIEAQGERAANEIAKDVPEIIRQVLEAKRAAQGFIDGR